MTKLVAIEGADGVGKRTAAEALVRHLMQLGLSAHVISFPRYQETVGGLALGEFLSGRLNRPVLPSTAAVLYALDRLESREFLASAMRNYDVVICDRYIGSNVVYQASKVDPVRAFSFMQWIAELELRQFDICPPDVTFYLNTPIAISWQLMLRKNVRAYTSQQFDVHESDYKLQARVRELYELICNSNMLGRWIAIDTVRDDMLRSPSDIATEIAMGIQSTNTSQSAQYGTRV
jgi:dTMP kinase